FDTASNQQLRLRRIVRSALLVQLVQQLVQAREAFGVLRQEVLVVLLRRDSELVLYLRLRRLTPELSRELTNGIANPMALLSHCARSPVLPSQLVQNGTAHAHCRIRGELLVGGPVAAQCVQQAN